MNNDTQSRKGYLFAALAAVQWSLMGIFGKALFAYQIDPLTVVTLRATLVFITLTFILAIFRRRWFLIEREDWLFFAVYGLVGIASSFYLYFTAIDLVGAAVAAILLYTYPVFVTLLSIFFLNERITTTKLISLVLVLTGIVLVSGIGKSAMSSLGLRGVILALLAAVASATSSIFGKKAVQKYSSWTIVYYSMGFGMIFLLAAQFTFVGLPNLAHPPVFWSLLVGLSWISTLGANLAYVSSLSYIEASRASVTATIEPVIVVILAFLFFRETLSPLQIMGTVFVLAGVLVVQR